MPGLLSFRNRSLENQRWNQGTERNRLAARLNGDGLLLSEPLKRAWAGKGDEKYLVTFVVMLFSYLSRFRDRFIE